MVRSAKPLNLGLLALSVSFFPPSPLAVRVSLAVVHLHYSKSLLLASAFAFEIPQYHMLGINVK